MGVSGVRQTSLYELVRPACRVVWAKCNLIGRYVCKATAMKYLDTTPPDAGLLITRSEDEARIISLSISESRIS
jgi:hypothetical protein